MLWVKRTRSLCWVLVGLLLTACTQLEAATTTDLVWQAANNGLTPRAWVTTIAIDPNDPNYIYAGSYGRDSLYVSSDGGVTWQRAGDGVQSQPLFKLLFDPWHENLLWAGTADGLYRGDFAAGRQAAQWQRVSEWPLAAAVYDLVYDRMAGTTLFAAGEDRSIWTTADGGAWQPLSPLPETVGAILAVAVAADGVLLAGSDGAGLFRSNDGGRSWQPASPIGETFVAALWVAPWDPRLILARTREGLFRSTDGGASWTLTATELEDRVDAITGVASEEAIYLGMSSGELFRSTDQGISWQPWGTGIGRDGMFNVLLAAPDASHTFWAGTQTGLYHSRDTGSTWQFVPALGTVRATALAQSPDGTLYLGTEDGVAVSFDKGATWQPRSNGLPPRAVLDIEVENAASDEPMLLFAATEGDGIYTSSDGGESWQSLAWSNYIIPDIEIDPFDPQRLYARVAYERIYASDDRGLTWAARWNGMATTTELISFALSPHQRDLLYAGGVVDLFKSEDGALFWRRIAPELAGQSIFYLAVDRQEPDTLYAGATNGLYRSIDAGASWSLWGSGLAGITVTTLAAYPADPQRLYAGTKYHGVYASDDGGNRWRRVDQGMTAPGLEHLSIEHLLVDIEGEWLYAATGQGFWRAALPNP